MTTDVLDFSEVTAYAATLRNAAATIPAAVSVLRDVGGDIKTDLELNAPTGATHKLKDSIFLRESAYGGVLVGVHKFYARYYEYGTVRQPPRPFFRPVVRYHLPILKQLLTVEMMERIRVRDLSVGVNQIRRIRAGDRWRQQDAALGRFSRGP